MQPVREFGRFVQEHRGELIADGLGVGAAVGEQRCCGAVQPWCDRSEEDVLGACAVVPEALRERLGQLEQPLALRRDTERSVRPRRAAAEPVDQGCLGGFGGHAELGERAAGELVGLGEEPEDEMLRAQVVMTVFARRRSGSEEHVGGRSPQSGREITGRRRAERDITLLSGLLRHPERAADLCPAAVGLASGVDEMVEQLLGTGAQHIRESASAREPVKRRIGWRSGLHRGDQSVE